MEWTLRYYIFTICRLGQPESLTERPNLVYIEPYFQAASDKYDNRDQIKALFDYRQLIQIVMIRYYSMSNLFLILQQITQVSGVEEDEKITQ